MMSIMHVMPYNTQPTSQHHVYLPAPSPPPILVDYELLMKSVAMILYLLCTGGSFSPGGAFSFWGSAWWVSGLVAGCNPASIAHAAG
jgi:hypothetical protein